MNTKPILFILFLTLSICLVPVKFASAGGLSLLQSSTDSASNHELLTAFFDLRERETFVQLTNLESGNQLYHIQIFDVSNLCNENNFFDTYTSNDTHIYNMRDIQSNDGNPSGIELPDNAYGIVIITIPGLTTFQGMGNFRILDSSGYEYRTNMTSRAVGFPNNGIYTINFNSISAVNMSDIVGIYLTVNPTQQFNEYDAADVLNIFAVFNIDILDNMENLFSCRDVVFACVDQDNPLIPAILATDPVDTPSGFGGPNTANVASFEYGINEAIPHSKDGELLCPGNTISEGIIRLRSQGLARPFSTAVYFTGFIGLNNGNGRGSMDSLLAIGEDE